MSNRRIPPVDTKQYATPGGIHVKPIVDSKEVSLEIHHCTAYLSRVETLAIILQLIHSGQVVFGELFTEEVHYYLEQMEGS